MKHLFLPVGILSASIFWVSCGEKSANDFSKQNSEETLKLESPQPKADPIFDSEIDELIKTLKNLYKLEDSLPESEPSTKKPPYVKFSDIKAWHQAGDEHAAGYDAKGKLLAIYDLTYQNTLSWEFIGRSVLGTVGAGDINLRELIRLIKEALKQKQMQMELGGKPGPMSSDDYTKINKVLEKVDAKYGDTKSVLTGDWASQLPMKSQNVDPLVSFKLSDIDMMRGMNEVQKAEFKRNVDSLIKNISQMFNVDVSNLFDLLKFQRVGNGNTYNLVLNPEVHLAPSEQPDKVVDFVRYQNTFGYALLYLAIKSALSNIGSAIPQPVVAALVKYAVHRWFELYEEQLSFHRFRAFEYISEAERADNSPFAFLTGDQRAKGGVYVLSHEASIFHTIFKPRNEAYYYQTIKHEQELVKNNAAWTSKRNLTLKSLNSLYYYGDNATDKLHYLLEMGGQPRFAKAPFVAIDYVKPHNERIKRNVIKMTYDVIQALPLPTGTGFLLSVLYDVFLMDDVRDAIRWDARLVSFLNTSSEKDFSKEISLIYAQRVNPFEFTLDEEKVFVERSKHYLGL